MTLPQMIEALDSAGFAVTWNDSHTEAYVSLTNRKPSTMEVVTALGFRPRRIASSTKGVMIQE